MTFLRVRLTVGRLMALVAMLALAMTLFRVDPVLAALAAAVSILAMVRVCEKIDGARAAGRPMGKLKIVRTAFVSVLVGIAILAPSLLLACCITLSLTPASLAIDGNTILGLALSASISIPITSSLRRKIW